MNLVERQYPETERFVCGLLVEIIAHAKTWHEIEKAAEALFHTRLIARNLRDEDAKFRAQHDGAMQEAQAQSKAGA